ncbi:MAG: hypothetical protein OEL53_08970 [Rhodospirillales bacterium]|nr:hypothetical protein [Rhodospirillales bacterium]
MGHLDKLKLSEKPRQVAEATTEGRMRRKLADAINMQIGAAEAMLKGEAFNPRRTRWVKDEATGEAIRKDMPLRFRPWYWQDESGAFMLEVRYGNKRIEIKPKKATIDVGNPDAIVPTLQLVRDAVLAGELDKQLEGAKGRFAKRLKGKAA